MAQGSEKMTPSVIVVEFLAWAAENQVFIHPSLEFVPLVAGGHSICAKYEIPPNTKILSCPFDVAITAPQSRAALATLFQDSTSNITAALEGLNERQIICLYMVLHRIWPEVKQGALPLVFRHEPYLNILPPPSSLLTPLYFSQGELDMLEGSNLYSATLTRRQEWKTEWNLCSEALQLIDPELAPSFTLERYLVAATYLSSRAFPSTLLSSSPTNASPETSHQVLLPGIDSLNHQRAAPVSWIASTSDDSNTLDLVLHKGTPAGAECFNNYGPKPNSELILGYGFALTSNPDDTILLSLASSDSTEPNMVEVGRGARNAERLWELVVTKVTDMFDRETDQEGEAEDGVWEIELEAAETIMNLTERRIQRLPELRGKADQVRPEVASMVECYLKGQKAILMDLVQWAQLKRVSAADKARALGIDVDADDELGEDGDSGE